MGLRRWILWVAGHLVPRRTSNICRSGWLERFRDAHVAGLWNIDAPGLGSYVERCCFPPRFALTLGAASLFAGVALALVSLSYSAIAFFFLGTAIAGVGFGAGFQGAIRTVVPFAAPHERAGVLSIVFIISFIAMGVPAVLAGLMIARHGNVLATAEIFGAVIMALACSALLGSVLQTLTRRAAARV
jgi:MFS family permease